MKPLQAIAAHYEHAPKLIVYQECNSVLRVMELEKVQNLGWVLLPLQCTAQRITTEPGFRYIKSYAPMTLPLTAPCWHELQTVFLNQKQWPTQWAGRMAARIAVPEELKNWADAACAKRHHSNLRGSPWEWDRGLKISPEYTVQTLAELTMQNQKAPEVEL